MNLFTWLVASGENVNLQLKCKLIFSSQTVKAALQLSDGQA